ncbi:hypothetical protein CL622_02840 [archaeon]|nr:hypothetical protein [archaeon]
MKWLANLFSGGTMKTVEKIATDLIETEMETAEAKAVMIKTLDPNGLMRRNLSRRVTGLYTLYILVVLTLLLCKSFDIGNAAQLSEAIDVVQELFVPITTMFTAIVSASFGVNAMNTHKDK